LAGLPDLISGNYASAGLTSAGAILGGMTPLGPLGSLLGGTLGKIAGGLFGKKHKNEPEFQVGFGLGFDDFGNLTTSGVGNPAHADYRGTYIWGRGPGSKFGEAARTVDATITAHLQPWLDTMQQINDALPENLAASFRDAVGTIDYSWYAETHHPEDSLNAMLDQIDALMADSLGPLTEQFGKLAETLTAVNPAFAELLGSLGSATGNYFGPLTAIDQQIAAAGGGDYLNRDLAWQADTYKLLFDNAVQNNSAAAWQLGSQYAEALGSYSDATGISVRDELEQIRADMIAVAGSPEDFQASVLRTLEDFRDGVQRSINDITTAISDLHPEIKLGVDVDIVVEDGEATITHRSVA
jgi:hypothetical protein